MNSDSEAGSYLRLTESMYRSTLGWNREEERRRDYRLGELGLALPLPGLPLHRNVHLIRGGLAFKALKLVYRSTLGVRVRKKKREEEVTVMASLAWRLASLASRFRESGLTMITR